MAEGAVRGGKLDSTSPKPAVFNTGMVLLGWSALIHRTGYQRYKDAVRKAGEWLLSVQDPDGCWRRGNSSFANSQATLYNVKAAWGLAEAGVALGDNRFIKAAVRNAEYCISRQHENGWFPDCCLRDPSQPLLHTLAYTMQGLTGTGKLTGEREFIAAAKKDRRCGNPHPATRWFSSRPARFYVSRYRRLVLPHRFGANVLCLE